MRKTIEKYLVKLREATSRPGVYAYRGQEDASWPLHSGATRRLIRTSDADILNHRDFFRIYVSYHRDTLLEPARTLGFGIEGGFKVSDLQLLAKLQHFGAATGLLDFTWDPLVALWFACQSVSLNGKLFIVNTNDTVRIAKISSDQSEHTVENIFSQTGNRQPLSYWEPTPSGDAEARILRQRSVFIIEKPLIPNDANVVGEIEINKKDKADLLEDLRLLDTSLVSIFQDIYGFSQTESVQSSIRQIKEPRWYLIQGNRSYQDDKISEAIRYYSECINLASDFSEPYFLRGNAKAVSEQYEDAIHDYNKAIDHQARPFLGWEVANSGPLQNTLFYMVYHNRGNAKAELSDSEGALKDYSESIRLAPYSSQSIFNRGNMHLDLCRLDEAINDYERVVTMGNSRALFNKGNALVMLGRFDEALECYRSLEQENVDAESAAQNRTALEAVIGRIGNSGYKVHLLKNDPKDRNLLHVAVRIDSDAGYAPSNVLFRGRVGNVGNFGMNEVPGGKGLKGKPGFIVAVESKSRE